MTRTTSRSITRAALALLASVALACKDTTEPALPDVARLVFGAIPDTVGVGDTLAFVALPVDAWGAPVENVTVAWSSSTPARVETVAGGKVRPIVIGDLWLVARAVARGRTLAQDSVRVHVARLARTVLVTAPRDSLMLGDTVRLSARVLDGLGVVMPDAVARFRSEDVPSVTVDSLGGLATVVADGDTRVAATSGDARGTVTLRAWMRPFDTGAVRLTQVDLGWRFGCGLDAAGAAYCWGNDARGQLGRGSASPAGEMTFGAVATASRYRTIGAGRGAACAVTLDGDAECWGAMSGDWYTAEAERFTPRRVPLPLDASDVRSVHMGDNGGHCLLDEGGVPYCFGANANGQLGAREILGDVVQAPTRIPGMFGSIRTVHPGYLHGCGARYALDGVYCWGSSTGNAMPQLVPNAPPLREVALGALATCGLDEGGATWCWGSLATNPDATPARMNAPRFVHLEAAFDNVCGITAGGDILCWQLPAEGLGVVTSGANARPFSRRHRFVDMAVGPHAVCGLTAEGVTYCREGAPAFVAY